MDSVALPQQNILDITSKGSIELINAANSNSDGRLAFISANKFLVTNELVGAVPDANITKAVDGLPLISVIIVNTKGCCCIYWKQ
jgi:hypothetical protein